MRYPIYSATIAATGTVVHVTFDTANNIASINCVRNDSDMMDCYYPIEENPKCIAEMIAMIAEHEIKHYMKLNPKVEPERMGCIRRVASHFNLL